MEQTADPLARLRAAAATGHAAGLRRTLRARTPDDDGLLDPASDDHPGPAGDERRAKDERQAREERKAKNERLAGHERQAVAAVRTWGTGSTGSRPVTASTAPHACLEARLSAFTGAAGGPVFPSGHLADLVAVAALGRGAPVVPDAGDHASIVGARRPSRSRAVDARSCLRLTARANLSSDDLAVIRGALTAVAEMKVTM
jgi:8-amino-7-oxononanoate synthase